MTDTATILPFPPKTHRTVQLVTIDTGHVFASAGFCGRADVWSWITETVANELGAEEDRIGCAEGPDGEDFVTLDGLPVYLIL